MTVIHNIYGGLRKYCKTLLKFINELKRTGLNHGGNQGSSPEEKSPKLENLSSNVVRC